MFVATYEVRDRWGKQQCVWRLDETFQSDCVRFRLPRSLVTGLSLSLIKPRPLSTTDLLYMRPLSLPVRMAW